jgi:hypothetical protein
VTPAVLDRMLRDLKPVRPRPSTGALAGAVLAVFAAIGVAGATILGAYGWHRLTPLAVALIFPALIALASLTAYAAVGALIPGAKRLAHPAVLTGAACLIMPVLFAVVFPDHRTDSFVHQGMGCLRAGLLWAIPAGAGTWLVLRRGFAVDRHAAGMAIGTLAGLAGLTVLELHCPNFRMPHVAVWHTAAVPIAAAAGYFLGSKRRDAELMQ